MRSKILVHSRPAALISQTAKTFDCDIIILHNGKTLNAKSIMQLLSANIEKDDEIEVEARKDAKTAIEKLFIEEANELFTNEQ